MNLKEIVKKRAGTTVLLTSAFLLGAYELAVNQSPSNLNQPEQIQNAKKGSLLVSGDKILVHKGVDLPILRNDDTIDPNSHLPGFAHPDILITNPITNAAKTEIKFFYRSYWHILLIVEDKTKVEIIERGDSNAEFQESKAPQEQNGFAKLLLKDGKVIEQKVEEIK